MVVMTPREKWTDERLDDLGKKVDDGFENLRTEIADTKAEMRSGFARVDADLRGLHDRLAAQNRTLIAGFFVVVAAIIGSNAAFYSLLA
ncbi:MAG TPA: hypothetical protein VFJ76_00870 [Solirubrobacterales bacterium]|nr:hypothetical protein [Solirubrobacterales bacterium]